MLAHELKSLKFLNESQQEKKETKIFRKEKKEKETHLKIRDDDDYPQPQQSFKKEGKRRTNVLKTSRKKD